MPFFFESLSHLSWTKPKSWDRLRPMLSKAPAFIRLSTTFLFTFLESTRLQKWVNDEKPPHSSLALRMLSRAASPTPLMPSSPYLILPSTMVKTFALSLTSGGRMATPLSLHSVMYLMRLSVSFTSFVRMAAMKGR